MRPCSVVMVNILTAQNIAVPPPTPRVSAADRPSSSPERARFPDPLCPSCSSPESDGLSGPDDEGLPATKKQKTVPRPLMRGKRKAPGQHIRGQSLLT